MRAGLAFVLLSLVLGYAVREWRRSNEVRFADLVRDLETGEAARAKRPERASADPDPARETAAEPRGSHDVSSARRSRRSGAAALRPGVIDVDRASPAELERLPGIGPSLAARIVADRERNGPFRGAEALLRVPGIGPRTLERIRPYLRAPRAPADSGSPIAN
jgi:competence protein ComEA